jgi:hypothetical protein
VSANIGVVAGGVSGLVKGPVLLVERKTVYDVAPATSLQLRSISDDEAAAATRPAGVAGAEPTASAVVP